jgi:cephalosporin hydroxylase
VKWLNAGCHEIESSSIHGGAMETQECQPVLNYDLERVELRKMGIDFPQRDKEFKPLVEYLATLRPRNLVEIGTRDGGSLFMLSRLLPPNSTIISVDLPGLRWGRPNSGEKKNKVADQLRRDGFTVHLVERNSAEPQTAAEVSSLLGGAPIEMLFLDADHTYKGVVSDLLNYQPLVKSGAPIIFHDIVESPKTPGVEVHFLWRVLKTYLPHVEFVESEAGWGIGVALNIRPPLI